MGCTNTGTRRRRCRTAFSPERLRKQPAPVADAPSVLAAEPVPMAAGGRELDQIRLLSRVRWAFALALSLQACQDSVSGSKDGRFLKRDVTAKSSVLVVFENQGSEETHVIRINPHDDNIMKVFVSELLRPGDRWAVEFIVGTYPHLCTVHRDREEEGGVVRVAN